jgi:transglutaminase-like putative cysteine protease
MPALGNQGNLPLFPNRAEGVKTVEVVQTVTVLRKDKLSVLFAAGPVASISGLKSNNNDGLKWNPEQWELSWSKPARVESYSVVSQVAVLNPSELKVAKPVHSIDPAPYLQLPDTVPPRVRQLANEVTNSATNDYDRAKMLEKYLKDTYPYTNTPDLTRMTNRQTYDVVDSFLFEIKEGYCDYFSTSFVVMARSIGLPTRWVKGYSTGFDPTALEFERFGGPPKDTNPTGAGTYTVRNADAHSWAEVYFEGSGWIPFEPTPGFSVPQPLPEGEVPVTDPAVAVNADPAASGLTDSNKSWLVIAGAAGVVVIIASLVFMGYRSRRFGLLWRRIRYRGNTPNQRVVREMEKLLSFLHRRGLRREPHETIRETFSRWSGKFTSLKSDFDGAMTNFEQARYGYDKGNDQVLNGAAARIRKAL